MKLVSSVLIVVSSAPCQHHAAFVPNGFDKENPMRPNTPPTRRHSLLALATVLMLMAASCGGGDTTEASGGGEVASIDANSDTTTADQTSTDLDELEAPENPEDAFALFDECMAGQGFDFGSAFTSVGGDSSAVIEIDPSGPGDDFDPQDPARSIDEFDIGDFEAANEQCEGHLGNIDQFADLSPEEKAAFEDAQLEFSDCMAEQGVEIPEFDGAGGGLVIASGPVEVDPQTGTPSFDSVEAGDLDAAFEACSHIFEDVASN